MKETLLLFVLLLACGTPTIRVYSEHPAASQLVEEAGNILGVHTKMMRKPGAGVTVLEIRPPEPPYCGQALEVAVSLVRALRGGKRVTCTPRAWSCPSPVFVAHELGHVYGLDHVACVDGSGLECENNVMLPAPRNNSVVTDGQTAVVESQALRLERACR